METPSTITAAELVIRRLQQHGIQQAFGVVGGAIMYITDALRRNDGIRSVFPHHEQGAAIAAEAYSKLTNKPALLFATAGPGATNVITGVADAYMDSIPMVVLLGDVRSTIAADFSKQRYNAPQEVNQAALLQPIVKQYMCLAPDMDARCIVAAIDALVHVAVSGRPGPVCIAMPLDVQAKNCDTAVLAQSIETVVPPPPSNTGLLRDAMQALLNAKRPMVLLGAGVRLAGMATQVECLLAQYRLPWCVSIGAVDLQDQANPLSCGCVGPTSQRAANTLLQAADCVLALATSFDQSVTGFNIADLLKNKSVFLINVDPGEKLRFNNASIRPIDANLGDFFEAIAGEAFSPASHDAWREEVFQVKAVMTSEVESTLRTTVGHGFLSAYDITDEISRHLPSDATVVLGISLDAHTVFNAFKVTRGQRVIVSRNLGPMGWDVPALLGAAFASATPRMLVLITGDGSLMVNVQELAVVAALQIPVCIFVFSNDGYASIRTTQANFFGMQFFGCSTASGLHVPPLEPLARGFGFDYETLDALEAVRPLLAHHAKAGTPRLVECRIDPGQLREPRLVSKVVDGIFKTPPVYDMTPALKPDLVQVINRLVSVDLD
jgi:acetolactate synthase I/II/III large subunit